MGRQFDDRLGELAPDLQIGLLIDDSIVLFIKIDFHTFAQLQAQVLHRRIH